MPLELGNFEEAEQNEAIFRKVLEDLKTHEDERAMGFIIPDDLNTEGSVEEICAKYATGTFAILNF